MFFNQLKKYNFPYFNLIPNSDCLLCRANFSQSRFSHNSSVNRKQTVSKLLCQHCHALLPELQTGCFVCAMPLLIDTLTKKSVCGACLKDSPHFSQTIAAFHYEAPVNNFITQLKFNAQRHYVALLADYLVRRVEQHYQNMALPAQNMKLPDLIIPVPLHVKKIRQRGFNQAQLIAQYLSKQLNIPCHNNIAHRIRNTRAQSSLDAKARQRNLKGAFQVSDLHQQSIALVDDVVTTGTTVNELSIELIKSGASRVDVWSLARAYAL